jgi:hypothetical protein
VIYPIAERPSLEIGRTSFEVVECSERGLRYDVGERRVPAVGSEISARLVFRSGEVVTIVGEVIRIQDPLVAIVLEPPGIAFSVVIREQRYLRGKGYRVTD